MSEKRNKSDVKDIAVKVILVIIIILLLIHNCSLIKMKNKDKVPSGNVNIIEITCIDNNKCDKEQEQNPIDNGSTASNESNDTNNNKATNRQSDNSTVNNQDTNVIADNSNDSSNNVVVDEKDENFKVTDSELIWKDVTPLKIFTDSVYQLEGKIAPESSNTYQFVVKNSTKYKLKYRVSFIESNPYHINMQYKLKKNDTYLVDHYVSYDELNISEQLLNSNENDTFYLEWKWASSDNDNAAGANAASYSLQIEVKAESTDE